MYIYIYIYLCIYIYIYKYREFLSHAAKTNDLFAAGLKVIAKIASNVIQTACYSNFSINRNNNDTKNSDNNTENSDDNTKNGDNNTKNSDNDTKSSDYNTENSDNKSNNIVNNENNYNNYIKNMVDREFLKFEAQFPSSILGNMGIEVSYIILALIGIMSTIVMNDICCSIKFKI
jgi:hypothetical protein